MLTALLPDIKPKSYNSKGHWVYQYILYAFATKLLSYMGSHSALQNILYGRSQIIRYCRLI